MRVKIKQIQRRIEALARFRKNGTEIAESVHLNSANEDRKHLVAVIQETHRKIQRAVEFLRQPGGEARALQALDELLAELSGDNS